VASLVRSVEDFVVEDGKVKCKTQADRVGGRKLSLSNLSSSLVGLEGLVGRILAAVTDSELGEVTVVVTLPARLVNKRMRLNAASLRLHLVVEDLGLARLSGGNKVLVENLENVVADFGELGLNLLSVLLDKGNLRRVAL
jgi:hypothetical protein